jgi:3-hydroxyisobutyrate dehydrogenase-like beta-hydroxyacid dehydrogenase
MTVIAVLGIGEAGSAIIEDLLAAGVEVRAYDPRVAAPAGTVACRDEAEAAEGADLVLSVNSAADSVAAALVGGSTCGRGSTWADLNTAAPERKLEVEAALPGFVEVADVALMAPVPGRGLHTPMIASGPGGAAVARTLEPLGASVSVLAEPVGSAAQRKLLRSVFFKGMSAAVTESIAAAEVCGLGDWMRSEITRSFVDAGEGTVDRLEEGSRRHAIRREHEMSAAVAMLQGLGVPPRVSAASEAWLRDLSGSAR